MVYNEKIRKNIYDWRESHREQYNQYMVGISREYYNKNKEIFSLKAKKKYQLKKEFLRLSSILLEGAMPPSQPQ
jgi:hypothetical protein